VTREILALGLSALVLAGAAGQAQAQSPAEMAAKPAASKFLAPGALDPAALLPSPPADGSPGAAQELAELHRIEAARSPERAAQALHDEDVESVEAFGGVMGPGFDLARLPATAQLFKDLRAEDKMAAKAAKSHFLRTRPWAADTTLKTVCSKDDAVKSSYPSGHATMAFAAAAVLARLAPEKAQAIQARAADYAESRLVCGVHYRRDIEAGQTWGTVLAVKLMDTPAFRSELDAARTELKAAGVVR
jgi:acid phosphatase (class A)